MVLFISGGEIFIILLAILIFFGADKIPEFARMMGKGVREFKKATDDIKREFNENTSGVMDDIKSIQNNLTDTFTREIAEPMQETATEATKTFNEYEEQYNADHYYSNPDYLGSRGNEYQEEAQATTPESTDENVSGQPSDTPIGTESETDELTDPESTTNTGT